MVALNGEIVSVTEFPLLKKQLKYILNCAKEALFGYRYTTYVTIERLNKNMVQRMTNEEQHATTMRCNDTRPRRSMAPFSPCWGMHGPLLHDRSNQTATFAPSVHDRII